VEYKDASRAFPVADLERPAWGLITVVRTEMLEGYTSYFTTTRVQFVVDNFVAAVVVSRFDVEDATQPAIDLARKLRQRVQAVKAGKFDDDAAARLTVPDLLVLSADAMADENSLHLGALREFRIGGEETAIRLDYDVALPDRALGYIEAPDVPAVEVFVDARAAFYRERGSLWRCLDEISSGDPVLLGFAIPDLKQLLGLALVQMVDGQVVNPLDHKESGGSWTIRTEIQASQFVDLVPELLGPRSYLRHLYPNIGEGRVRLEYVVRQEDYWLTDVGYEINLPVPGDQVLIRHEMSIAASDATFPETRLLPLCSQYEDPPCKGSRLATCLAPAREIRAPAVPDNACDGSRPRVCIVPIGAVSKKMLDAVVDGLRLKFDAEIKVAPAQSAPKIEELREQVADLRLWNLLGTQYSRWFNDPVVTMIAITPVDMFSERNPNLRYLFGQRFGENDKSRWGVVSTFQMDNASFNLPEDEALLQSRLTKLLMKYILSMHYGLEDSADPSSVMYGAINSALDLDRMSGEVPAGFRR
jgi:predicted Zn-dependent protease